MPSSTRRDPVLNPLDRAALILAGLGYLLFKLGGRLRRAVDDNLADFGDE